jgi:hypothetical protein
MAQSFLWNELTLPKLKQVEKNGKRFYETPEGNHYPSVTTLLDSLPKDALDAWIKRVGEVQAKKIGTQSANRGEGLHRLSEKYLKNDPFYSKGSMPMDQYLFGSIRKYLDSNIQLIYGSEVTLYSNQLQVAGTTDLAAKYNEINSIIDFKTSLRNKKEEWIDSYFIQATAYSIMIEEQCDLKFPQIVLIIAVEHEEPQIFIRDKNKYVEEVFRLFDVKNRNTEYIWN